MRMSYIYMCEIQQSIHPVLGIHGHPMKNLPTVRSLKAVAIHRHQNWKILAGKPHDLNGKIDGFRLKCSQQNQSNHLRF